MAQPTEHRMAQTREAEQRIRCTRWRTLVTMATLGVLYGIVVTLPTPVGLSVQGQRILGVSVGWW